MQKIAFSIGFNEQIWLKRLFVAMATSGAPIIGNID